jgi:hypothetical protein
MNAQAEGVRFFHDRYRTQVPSGVVHCKHKLTKKVGSHLRTPSNLKRCHTFGHDHFITFSCYHRLPSLTRITPEPSSLTSSNKPASAGYPIHADSFIVGMDGIRSLRR